jgi:hypothetical protein
MIQVVPFLALENFAFWLSYCAGTGNARRAIDYRTRYHWRRVALRLTRSPRVLDQVHHQN